MEALLERLASAGVRMHAFSNYPTWWGQGAAVGLASACSDRHELTLWLLGLSSLPGTLTCVGL